MVGRHSEGLIVKKHFTGTNLEFSHSSSEDK